MNVFQKQLVLNDGRTLAERDGRPAELGVGPPEPPVSVSAEDFIRDMREADRSGATGLQSEGE